MKIKTIVIIGIILVMGMWCLGGCAVNKKAKPCTQCPQYR